MQEKIQVSAIDIYNELVNKFKIKDKIGSVEIKLGNITAKYNGKDAIGDLLQEWIGAWMKSKNYYFRVKANTQEFPDFLLADNDKEGLLEVKTFDAAASPAFDIASFDSYCLSLLTLPERIDADYLILGYKMVQSELRIDNIWLKKVWEISSPSGTNPVKLQRKRGQLHNLRPCIWYSKKLKYSAFTSKREFLKALALTQNNYSQCESYRENWLEKVENAYKKNTGTKL